MCPSWPPFSSEHGLSKRFPSWEPFLRSTSGQVDQKLLVTMMVTVFATGTSAHDGRKLKCGPSWSTFFIPETSDQVDLKQEIRAMMARIIWPGRRQKCAPSWRAFLRKPVVKRSAKLALLYYRSPSLKMWDNLSHISKKKANNRK